MFKCEGCMMGNNGDTPPDPCTRCGAPAEPVKRQFQKRLYDYYGRGRPQWLKK